MSNKFELIDGKHPKVLAIEYYDKLVSDVDIYAEELLENTKDDEYLNGSVYEPDFSQNFYESVEKQFEDTAIDKYKLEEEDDPINKVKVKDFVHSQRMRAIEAINAVQKQQVDELNAATKKPTTLEEALFANKFCFHINFAEQGLIKPKFKLLTFVVDFYLDEKTIQEIKYKYLSSYLI
jgi:hypothetical protein